MPYGPPAMVPVAALLINPGPWIHTAAPVLPALLLASIAPWFSSVPPMLVPTAPISTPFQVARMLPEGSLTTVPPSARSTPAASKPLIPVEVAVLKMEPRLVTEAPAPETRTPK